MAIRIASRLASRRLYPVAPRRTLVTTPNLFDAQNFTMPAMSPTMTEGNISSWKVKEGDSFSTGDILLEIETDKATMDVEAQDDGIMAKILQADGTKSVQVGSRIAVLAEPGDDISSIQIPPDGSKAAPKQGAKKENPKSEASEPSEVTPSRPLEPSTPTSSSSPPSQPGQNAKYPLYPAVAALVHENHIPESEIPKLPATGPGGRLLKGDVLSYLGRIQADYSSMQSKRIEHLAHMDLSNIKIAPQAEKKPGPRPEAPAVAQLTAVPVEISVSLPISLTEVLKIQKRVQDTLGVSIPLSTFLARAVDVANDDLPKTRDANPSPNDLFNAVLGLDSIPQTSRGTYIPQIAALPSASVDITATAPTSPRRVSRIDKNTPDIIDILAGKVSPKPGRKAAAPPTFGVAASHSTSAMNVFSVTVPPGEQKRARTFLERVKTVLQVEPGRLVL
jgi:Biotin-requiring enzyme/e3 binding domain